MAKVRISAVVSRSTEELLDAHARAMGVTRDEIVDAALTHYLRAVEEPPPEYIVNSTITVSRRSWDQIMEQAANPQPTKELRDLMRGRIRPG